MIHSTWPLGFHIPVVAGAWFVDIHPGSQASYVRNLLAIVSGRRSDGGLGYRGAVVNSRGCELPPDMGLISINFPFLR